MTVFSSPLQRYKSILSLSWPVMMSYLSYQILGITDMLMVSQLGTEALASVGLALTLFMFLSLPLEGLFDSATILLSKAYGGKKYTQFQHTLWHEVGLGLILSSLAVCLYPVLTFFLKWMSPNDAVYDLSKTYLFLIVLSLIPYILNSILTKSLISIHRNKPLMIISNITVILNIVLNYAFIFGELGAPELGVAGSALATLVARIFQATTMAVYCIFTYRKLFGTLEKWSFDVVIIKKIFSLGLPIAQGNLLEISAWTLFVGFIGQIGVAALAAHEICMKVKDIAFMPGLALSSISTSLVGNAVGERDYTKVKQHYSDVSAVAVAVMGFVGVVIFIFPNTLLGIFTEDARVIELGINVLRLLVVYQIIDAVFIVLRGSLNGLGATHFMRNMLLLGGWFIMLPSALLFIFVFNLGVIGAWLGLTLNVTICGIIMYQHFNKTVYRKQQAMTINM